jgi:hypothetical protein
VYLVCTGDEPQLVVEGLEDMPAFTTPELQEVPEFQEPPLHVPTWSPPCEPQPVGFLRGCGPLLIMDVSGTMHPARRGMLPRVKACVASLLTPNGEERALRSTGWSFCGLCQHTGMLML